MSGFSLKTALLKRAVSKRLTKAVVDKLGHDLDIDILALELDGDDTDDMTLHVEADIDISADDLVEILENGAL